MIHECKTFLLSTKYNLAILHKIFYFSVRLISIAAQKFISDIANDALQHCKTKANSQTAPNKNQKDKDGKGSKDRKYTLTVEDLAPALNENYGITVRKANYFV